MGLSSRRREDSPIGRPARGSARRAVVAGEPHRVLAIVPGDAGRHAVEVGLHLLPPPALLWSVFGVFRAPQGATLVSTRTDSSQTVLKYQAGDQQWTFSFSNNRLTRSEWTGPAQGRQTVEIREYGMRGLPARVVYRDWRAFRELSVTLTQAIDVAEPFPPDTWLPGSR